MKVAAYRAVLEAMRRFESFSVNRLTKEWHFEDLKKAWTGFGTKRQMKEAIEEGLFVCARDLIPRKGIYGWWKLTEKGAIFLYCLHFMGYKSVSYGNPDIPKSIVEQVLYGLEA